MSTVCSVSVHTAGGGEEAGPGAGQRHTGHVVPGPREAAHPGPAAAPAPHHRGLGPGLAHPARHQQRGAQPRGARLVTGTLHPCPPTVSSRLLTCHARRRPAPGCEEWQSVPGEAAPQLTSSSSRSGLSSAVAARMLRPPSSATPRPSAQHTGVRGPVKLSAAAPRTRSCFHLRRATLNTSTAVSAVTSSLHAAAAESCLAAGLAWPHLAPPTTST